MFEVGFTEIILILGIALVVLGPEKLPKVAADIGRWVGRARAMARQFKNQLDEEVIKGDRDWAKPQPTYTPPPKPAPTQRAAEEPPPAAGGAGQAEEAPAAPPPADDAATAAPAPASAADEPDRT